MGEKKNKMKNTRARRNFRVKFRSGLPGARDDDDGDDDGNDARAATEVGGSNKNN